MVHHSFKAWFALVLLVCACPAFAQTFVFHLRGDQEVPPVASAASGGCMGQLDQPAATFSLTCVHDVIGATVMHVHLGPAGVNGPIVFDLGDPASPVTATWTGMTPAEIADLLAGNLYLNIHTAGRPAGEIRGQILTRTVDSVPFTMDGGQVVPPNTTTATGTCTSDLSNDATQLDVQCTHDLAGALSAHVHQAPAQQNGPIVFTFPSPGSPLAALVPLTPELVASFAATFLYVDVHTASGAEDTVSAQIRGQIGEPPAAPTTGTIRIVKATDPAGGSGFTFTETVTPGTFSLNDGGTQTFTAVAAGTYTITEDDPAGLGFSVANVSCDDLDSTGDAFSRTATVELQAGEVVTCTFRNLQSNATDSIFVFHMSGDQEAPPVVTPHRGGCMGRFDAASSRLTLICTHDVESATIAHIHQGAPGVNGPIVFDLGPPESPIIATWESMTPAEVANLMAGNYYANIHTAGRPAGEIRGQILPRTVDVVNFPADASQVVPPGISPATGSCSADLDGPATSLAVQCTHNLPAPDLAHVHQAPFGENGPEVFTFPSAASPISGNVPMTPRLVADFAATFLYVDIHGVGGGEGVGGDQIRGQIGAPPLAPTTGTIRIIKSTEPAGGSGFNFTDDIPGSSGSFTLSDGGEQTFASVPAGTYTVTEAVTAGYSLTDVSCSDTDSSGNPFARTATVQLQGGEVVTCTFRNLQTSTGGTLFVFHMSGDQEAPPVATTARGGCMGRLDPIAASFSVVCTHDVAGPAVAHIHQGGPGINGPILFDLGAPDSPIEATWTGMTPAEIADLQAGNLYINVHSGGRPSGEIRGQILPRTVDNFSFPADQSQEVPPTGSSATGSCTADLADDAASLFVQCTHNVTNVTNIHLHSAPPGVDGPVVFDFPATNPFSANVPMSPRLVADFAAGFLYVNIHSADFPEGEIRGQLIAGATNVGDIPTLNEWAVILLALSLVTLAWWRIRG